MFFKKRREEAERKAAEAREQTLRAFDEKYEAAVNNPDPAARILQLKDMKEAIDTFMDMANGKAVSDAKGKWLGGYFGGVIGASLIIDGISILLTGVPASMLAIIPSIIIGSITGDTRVLRAGKKNIAANETFYGHLREKKKRADKSIESTLESDMRAFAKSPKFEELLESMPSLRAKFAEAFKREVEHDDISPKPEDMQKKKGGFHL